ncbi:triose-phosphate isomerase [Sedimentisphaera salicampi]|uniref:Triosephosphate isomerase n=1 Tax=Sedimentisphaera salicampi TaxID=1941349 RepID=A0A1W6LNR6_9BACT|nr:triose-phosphate isomerase [Sedimentisphaera salicampi]ARN57438.1 Triosephosphate isomerase [Sedimentisphaera salicampi]OXU14454.1 Triosephosphate isomerase [Sedimentisphaera salicampi]
MRKPFIAANWKMNTDSQYAVELASGLEKAIADVKGVNVAVCPPFVYLQSVAKSLSVDGNVAVGSQDVYFESNGAFTGEISCEMLKDVCCSYVITGHSERRHVIGESDELINKKTIAALEAGIKPILCIGELLEEREADKTSQVCERQLREGLKGISEEQLAEVTIAYEPVWAIGTGKTATSQQAQEVHEFVRGVIADLYSKNAADNIIIQYGGSAKPKNTKELMSCKDVDGLLVGGAGLKVDSFSEMVKITEELYK